MPATNGHHLSWASSMKKETEFQKTPLLRPSGIKKEWTTETPPQFGAWRNCTVSALVVRHDESKAKELLEKAAAMGDKAAPKFIEKHEQDRLHPKAGQSIKEEAYRAYKQKQFEKAAKLYRQCADMGNDQCQLALGVQYEFGEGVPKNESQAVAWYQKSADQGNAIGQKTLGLMYELGKGVGENWAEAFRLYSLSAPKYKDGAFALARMYEFGMGVPQNRAAGHRNVQESRQPWTSRRKLLGALAQQLHQLHRLPK